MQFIVDESTGAAVTAFLRSIGHDSVSVTELMPQAADAVIPDFALNQSRIVVTNDKDFGELIFRSGKSHSGVLLLWLRDDSSVARVRSVRAVLEQFSERLSGRFVVATETSVRIRSAT